MKRWLSLLLLGGFMLAALPQASVAQSVTDCFVETPYCIQGPIRDYWWGNGSAAVFGYPIRSQGDERSITDGEWYPTQWFERHRLEVHEDDAPPYNVQLGLLGSEAFPTSGFTNILPGNVSGLLRNNCLRTIPGFSFNTCGRFATYWQRYGLQFTATPGISEGESLALHGGPISAVGEMSVEGKVYQVQWFERARFEWHGPGSIDNRPINDFDVLFGRLGAERFAAAIFLSYAPLPLVDERRMQETANQRNLVLNALAEQETVVFNAASLQGTAILVTPLEQSLEVAPEALLANPALLGQRALGGVRVTAPVSPDLPPDTYVVNLAANGQNLIFSGTQGRIQLPAVIRALPQQLPRPIALITALPGVRIGPFAQFNRQICFAWQRTEVCGLLTIPIQGSDQEAINDALDELGLATGMVDLDQTISLVTGVEQLDLCARSFSSQEPNYSSCTALVLAAPAFKDSSIPQRSGPAGTSIGVVKVLSDLREEVYFDPELKELAGVLPKGSYAVFEIRRSDDLVLDRGVTLSRVLLSGNSGDFYLPAISGGIYQGDVLSPDLQQTPKPDAAVSTSLLLRDRCFFRVARCPYQP